VTTATPHLSAVPRQPAQAAGRIHVDRASWEARVDGRRLELTYLEFEALDFLVRHPGRVHSRAALLRNVWGYSVDGEAIPCGRTVDVLITRLRRKLGPSHRHEIETVRRVGYRYRPAAVLRKPSMPS
jgi:DNA-binding response OmpR family regulator